jgi:hypothetical protein
MMRKYKDAYLFLLTDDTGMLQHGKYTVPDPRYGYTTDDNARALILAVRLYEQFHRVSYEKLIYRYAGFLLRAQKDDGRFRNFMSYDRRWLDDQGSDDCQGRCVWAMAVTVIAPAVPCGIRKLMRVMLQKAWPQLVKMKFLRGRAYALLGLTQLRDRAITQELGTFIAPLCQAFEKNHEVDWQWFESKLTYSNALLPWALLRVYTVQKDVKIFEEGLAALDFLIEKTFRQGIFQPVGCKGWLEKGEAAGAVFDQQPLEAAEMTAVCLEAWKITGKTLYRRYADAAFAWYYGKNVLQTPLIENSTGGCFDGLAEDGVNENLGAESQVAYGIAWSMMYEFAP